MPWKIECYEILRLKQIATKFLLKSFLSDYFKSFATFCKSSILALNLQMKTILLTDTFFVKNWEPLISLFENELFLVINICFLGTFYVLEICFENLFWSLNFVILNFLFIKFNFHISTSSVNDILWIQFPLKPFSTITFSLVNDLT